MTDPLTLGTSPGATRVVVAMSGGVDSAVAAALVKGWGYDTVGITLQLYDHGKAVGKKGACCAGQDIHDARRVADQIGIPHYVLDFEERFRHAVIEDFAATYAQGRTPIPCVRCNQRVKFEDLLETARELGAAALVTGHYARRTGGTELHTAVDASRDQTYFLAQTTRAQLEQLRFPLGDHTKDEVRRMALELGLRVAQKAESRDICFVPQGHYSEVVTRLRPDAAEPGPVEHVDGRELGRHAGLAHFTVGQRRGLGVAAGEPLYVHELDAGRRAVIVGPKRARPVRALRLDEINWLDADGPEGAPPSVLVKHRAHESAVDARIETDAAGVRVVLREPGFGIAPGQACVVYAGSRVLGGGLIDRLETEPASAVVASA